MTLSPLHDGDLRDDENHDEDEKHGIVGCFVSCMLFMELSLSLQLCRGHDGVRSVEPGIITGAVLVAEALLAGTTHVAIQDGPEEGQWNDIQVI